MWASPVRSSICISVHPTIHSPATNSQQNKFSVTFAPKAVPAVDLNQDFCLVRRQCCYLEVPLKITRQKTSKQRQTASLWHLDDYISNNSLSHFGTTEEEMCNLDVHNMKRAHQSALFALFSVVLTSAPFTLVSVMHVPHICSLTNKAGMHSSPMCRH